MWLSFPSSIKGLGVYIDGSVDWIPPLVHIGFERITTNAAEMSQDASVDGFVSCFPITRGFLQKLWLGL